MLFYYWYSKETHVRWDISSVDNRKSILNWCVIWVFIISYSKNCDYKAGFFWFNDIIRNIFTYNLSTQQTLMWCYSAWWWPNTYRDLEQFATCQTSHEKVYSFLLIIFKSKNTFIKGFPTIFLSYLIWFILYYV